MFHVQFPRLGLSFEINRVALSIGGFNIYWYGICIALGMLLGLWFAFRYAPDFGLDGDRMVDVIVIGTVMAIVCARIYYVAMSPYTYNSLWEMIDIRQGGIAIYGSVFGAFVFGGLATKWRKMPVLAMYDAVAVGFLAGQGIGRWGNFFNQEAFGCNTSLPWGMISEGTTSYLSTAVVTVPAGMTIDPNLPVHPTFLYESIWCLLGFVLFARLFKHRRFNGEVFLIYIIWYGAERFVVEGFRTDSLILTGSLRTSQLVAAVSVVAAAILLVYGRKKNKDKVLMVSLPVVNLKKQKQAGDLFRADELPASASHAQFVTAVKAMNDRLEALEIPTEEVNKEENDHACQDN